MASEKKRLVILGGGFGSYRLALGLREDLYDVTVVSPRDHFLFTPLLASTTVGTIEFRSIIEPLRSTKNVYRNVTATCEQIDANARMVACRAAGDPETSFTLPYDLLVVGVGSVSQTFNIPGAREHALKLKELNDARSVRQ